MSVVFLLENKKYISMKGSPETLKNMFEPSSLPENYENTYKKFAFHGNRVLAFGLKEIKTFNKDEDSRSNMEKNLKFLGNFMDIFKQKNQVLSFLKIC
jgi:magnesium-transporting ATPase (P-type)